MSSKRADAYKNVVARPYPPGGCSVSLGEEKCGETEGLDIISDFHKLYEEKMSQIDVTAGGDSLQEKVDLQQDWINDLTEQNKMLAKVIEELEKEAINRVEKLEDKLKNAVKSLGEEDKEPSSAEKKERTKGPEESEKEKDKLVPPKQTTDDESFKQILAENEQEEEINPLVKKMSSKSQKSVLLIIEDEEPDKTQIVPPVKIPAEELPETFKVPYNTKDGKTVMLATDSFELNKGFIHHRSPDSEDSSEESLCVCDNNVQEEFEKLKEENRLLKEGDEIQRLKDEIDEKMKRILELNNENRALNNTINELKNKPIHKETSDSEPLTSDSEYGANEEDPLRNPTVKRNPTCDQKDSYNFENLPEMSQLIKKICVCRELDARPFSSRKKPSPECIDVYKRDDKDNKFRFDSSSTICNEEIRPFFKENLRARGGHDSDYQDPAQTDQCHVPSTCQEFGCPNDPCEVDERTTQVGKVVDEVILPKGGVQPDHDGRLDTSPEKKDYSKEKNPPSKDQAGTNDPDEKTSIKICEDKTCEAKCMGKSRALPEGREDVQNQAHQPNYSGDQSPNACAGPRDVFDNCACIVSSTDIKVNTCRPKSAPERPSPSPRQEPDRPSCEDCRCIGEKNDPNSEKTFDATVNAVIPITDATTSVKVTPLGDEMNKSKSCPMGFCEAPCTCGLNTDTVGPAVPKSTAGDEKCGKDPCFMGEKPCFCSVCRTQLEHHVSEKLSEHVSDKPTDRIKEGTSEHVSQKPSEQVMGEPSEHVKGEPSEHMSEKPSEQVKDEPSEHVKGEPSDHISSKPLEQVKTEPSEHVEVKLSEHLSEKVLEDVSEKPSKNISEKPSTDVKERAPAQADGTKPACMSLLPCDETSCDYRSYGAASNLEEPQKGDSPEKLIIQPPEPAQKPLESKPEPPKEVSPEDKVIQDFESTPKPQKADDSPERTIIRCLCKSKYCKVIPDPNNPKQSLCVDSSQTYLLPQKDESCECRPTCPKYEKTNDTSSFAPNNYKNEGDPAVYNNVQTPVYTMTTLEEIGVKEFFATKMEELSKEEEYAGVSRKDIENSRRRILAPRRAASSYVIPVDNDDHMKDNDELKDDDLKLVIANLKGKLLDAEDKIEELKSIKNFAPKDNNMALIQKYADEIEHLKKLLQWTKKEKEEYEYLKQKVKIMEKGKGDTESITSNLQTAEDKTVMKSQLKKLSKKNKCYEEVVQFFKGEMSVMSDELLTLQEVLNATNVCSQEENNKLINAILQLRRINDRLVNHLCAIEKQMVLENQLNHINETRINELQQIIGAKNNDLTQHGEIIHDMKRKLNNANKQNVDLKKKIQNLTDTVVDIQESLIAVERGQQKNQEQVDLVKSEVCLANGDLADIKKCMDQKNGRIEELENQLKSQEIAHVLAKTEIEMLKEKKMDIKEQVKTLREQLSNSERKREQIMSEHDSVIKQLQDYSSLDRMRNYELNHYKNIVEEMRMSVMQLNNGLERCEATNIHFYDELVHPNQLKGDILSAKKSDISIVFDELRRSMADMKKRLSDADFKGALIEEELLKVKDSHMTQIQEIASESEREMESRISSTIEEHSRLNRTVEEQKEEIEMLKMALEKEKETSSCCCKRSVSELKYEKMNANAQMELAQLKTELRKSLQRQRHLNDENDKMHTQMVNMRKKLTMMEHAYEISKQENEEYKMQLKKAMRENEYLNHKNRELKENIEQLKNQRDELDKQFRAVMRHASEEKNWIKPPAQRPFSPKRYVIAATTERNSRAQSPSKSLSRKRSPSPDLARYRSASPWRCCQNIDDVVTRAEDSHSHGHRRSKLLRNVSYDSNSSPFSSRSPSPRTDSLHAEQEIDEINLQDWFSPSYKETETDADDDVDEASFLGKVKVMTYHVQEANRRWQHMKNKERVSRTRTKQN